MYLLIVAVFIGLVLFGLGFILNQKNMLSSFSFVKNEIDINKLQNFVVFFRRFHFVLGGGIVFLSLILYFTNKIDIIGILITFIPLVSYIYFIIRMKMIYPEKEQKTIRIALYVLVFISVTIFGIFFWALTPNKLILNNDSIEISGIYGENILLSDIQSISLNQTLPNIKRKTNGFALQSIKKGYFKTADDEKIKLILNSLEVPCLLIERHSGKKIYYSDTEKNNVNIYQDYLILQHKRSHN